MKRRKFLTLFAAAPLALSMPRMSKLFSEKDLFSQGKQNESNSLPEHQSLIYYTYDNPVGYNLGRKIADCYRKAHPDAKIHVTSARAFMSDFLHNLRTDTLRSFRNDLWGQYDYIVLSDVDVLKLGQATRDEFRHICYHVHASKRKLIVNLPKDKMDDDVKVILKGFKHNELLTHWASN